MDEHLHNIDKLFKSAVDDYEESPPAGVWDGIDKQLDKSNIVSIQKKYAYLKRAVVAVVLLFSVATLFALLTWHPYRQPLQAARTKSHEKPAGQQQTTQGAAPADKQTNQLPSSGDDDTITDLKQKAKQTDTTNTLQSETTPSIAALHQPQASGGGAAAMQAGAKATATTIKNQKTKGPAEQIFVPLPPASDNNTGTAALTGNHLSGKKAVMTRRSLTPLFTIPSPVVSSTPILTAMPLSLRTASPGIAFLPATGSHSQTIKLTTPHRNPFSLTLFASPGITVNRLEADRPKNREDDKDAIRNGEHNNISFTAGITADLGIGKNFSLQSGLAFSSTTKTMAPKSIYARPDNHGDIQYRYNCSSGYYLIPAKRGSNPRNGDSIVVSGTTSTLQYVSIPLAVKYRFGTGKFSVQPLAGAALNILTGEKTETPAIIWGNAEPNLNNSISGLKPTYFSGLLSVEAEWQLSNRFALRLAPFSRFALTSMNREAAVRTYPAFFGLETGITIKL